MLAEDLPVGRLRADRRQPRGADHRLQPRGGIDHGRHRAGSSGPAVGGSVRPRGRPRGGAAGRGRTGQPVPPVRNPPAAARRVRGAARRLVLVPALGRGRGRRAHRRMPGPLVHQADGAEGPPGRPAGHHRTALRQHRARDPQSAGVHVGRHRGPRPRAAGRPNPRAPRRDRAAGIGAARRAIPSISPSSSRRSCCSSSTARCRPTSS